MINKEFLETLYLQRDQINAHIAKYEVKVDPYAELKNAHAAGKRIAGIPPKVDPYFIKNPYWDNPPEYYKILDDDRIQIQGTYLNEFNTRVNTKYTKCALTGEITAEVVK